MKRRIGTFVALLVVGFLLQPVVVHAAESLKAGDIVEVLYMSRWRQGTVVRGNARGMVLVDFDSGSGKEQGTFRRDQVRMAFETGALSPPHSWKDSEGNFLARAVVASIDGDKVKLRKSNMKQITVSISSLSAEDQKFLKDLQKEEDAQPAKAAPDNPDNSERARMMPSPKKNAKAPAMAAGPQPPPVEQFDGCDSFGGWSVSMTNEPAKRQALEPDPVPSYLKLKQGGVGFPKIGFFEKIGAVLPIGGKDSWLLAAVEDGTPSDAQPTQLIWASLVRQKIGGRQLLPPREIVMDYYPPGHRLLTYGAVGNPQEHWGFDKQHALTLWEVLPTDKQVKPIVRWETPLQEHARDVLWARMVNSNIVVQRLSEQEIVAWDTENKKMLYRTKQESFFAPPPVLSGGRKYLFIPEDTQVRVLEAATGEGLLTLTGDQASGVAVTEDGRRVAVLSENAVAIWDLTNPNVPPQRCKAESIGTPFHATLTWVGEDRLMVSTIHNLVLFSIPLKMAIWNYTFSLEAKGEEDDRRMTDIVGGHLAYSASVWNRGQGGMVVGAVKLPGPDVEAAVASFNIEAITVLKPGMAVRLEVQAGEYTERVRAAVQKKIEANYWKIDPAASIVVLAEMTRGKTETVTYRITNMGIGIKREGNKTEQVSITPEISKITITIGEKVAWSSMTATGASPFVTLKAGETVQGEVSKWQKPNPDFFDGVKIPDRIIDPDRRQGLGSTAITTRGLIPKSAIEREMRKSAVERALLHPTTPKP
jgi:hypothetical protein